MALTSISIAAVVLLCWVALKAKKYLQTESSQSPFKEVIRAKVQPKVLDQKKRDAVLKQGFTEDRVPKNLDAIVIGSGIGGLSVAALLAKAGKKVLVLEQHDQAGGCCHTFIEKGYEFDVGIHYVGMMHYHSPLKTYVDQITNGQLEWELLDDAFDQVIFAEKNKELRKYDVLRGKGKWEEYLIGKFPEEADNIKRFFRLVDEVVAGSEKTPLVKTLPLWVVRLLDVTKLINYLTNFFKWNNKTCKEVVWEITNNQELRDILCYTFLDYGTPPSKAGFSTQARLIAHYRPGAAYPVGGASEIAFHIIPVIEAAGGKVLVQAKVSKIVTDSSGQACGVKVKKGSGETQVMAPIIISDAGLYNTLERLLPRNIATSSRLWKIVQTAEHGPGFLSVFVGLDCDDEKLEIIHKKNAWVFSGNDTDKLFLDYKKMSRDEALDCDIPILFLSFPSTKDPEWKRKYPGKTTMSILTPTPYEWFAEWNNKRAKKRGDEYESIKKTFGHKAIEQACRLFPSIKNHIDYVSVGTPVSNNYYIGAPQGEIYGLDHTRERFSIWNSAILRAKTDIPGLYLTGQDMNNNGFNGALRGGLFSARAVLERNLMKDLLKIHQASEQPDKKSQ